MSVPVRDFLKSRRDRCLGSILGHLERNVYAKCSQDEREAMRRVVMDALNTYHDSVLDLLKAEDGNVVRNDEVIALLRRLDGLARLRAPATAR